jgi:hypothetical protein
VILFRNGITRHIFFFDHIQRSSSGPWSSLKLFGFQRYLTFLQQLLLPSLLVAHAAHKFGESANQSPVSVTHSSSLARLALDFQQPPFSTHRTSIQTTSTFLPPTIYRRITQTTIVHLLRPLLDRQILLACVHEPPSLLPTPLAPNREKRLSVRWQNTTSQIPFK